MTNVMTGYVITRYTCEECGDTFSDEPDALYDCDGRQLCDTCMENEGYMQCADCRKVIKEDDATWVDDERSQVCSECLEHEYIECACCSKYYSEDEIVSVDGSDERYCDDCLQDEEANDFAKYDDEFGIWVAI